MSDQAVLTERRDGVLIVTLNRPDARNAVNRRSPRASPTRWMRWTPTTASRSASSPAPARSSPRAWISRAFVKGERPYVGDRGFAGITQRAARKPLIAAVEGFAVAGGFEIVLSCDLVVAAKGAKLGIPRSSAALVAAGGGCCASRSAMPYRVVMELALTGDPCPPSASTSSGSSTSSPSRARRSTARWSSPRRSSRTRRSRSPPPRRSCSSQSTGPARRCGRSRARQSTPIFASEDAKEGATAFDEKRDPVGRVAERDRHLPAVDADLDRRSIAGSRSVREPFGHGVGPAADRGVRRRRLLDGGRQPAARRLRPLADAHGASTVCFMPTASGDADHYIVRFYRAFRRPLRAVARLAVPARQGAAPSRATSRRTCSTRTSSTSAAAACLAARRLARARPRRGPAPSAGGAASCCAGLSAGSLCWFHEAVTAFHGAPRRVAASACCRTPTACTTTASPSAARSTGASSAAAMPPGLRRRRRRGAALRRHASSRASCPRARARAPIASSPRR